MVGLLEPRRAIVQGRVVRIGTGPGAALGARITALGLFDEERQPCGLVIAAGRAQARQTP
eukprot:8850497-Pyramimonas_sp.AAC.1